MPEPSLQEVLRESTEEVLEKMFFIRSLDTDEECAPDTEVVAHLTFEGEPSGSLTLSVAAGAARSVAADFLGEDEPDLTDQQIGEVVCELANMICGSVLSRVESTATFHLASPRILASPGEGACSVDPKSQAASTLVENVQSSSVHAIRTCGGAMVVRMNTEISPWA